GPLDDADDHLRAGWAAKDDPRTSEVCPQLGDDVFGPAVIAGLGSGGHLDAQDRRQRATGGIPVETGVTPVGHDPLLRHVPLGPKRSVLTRSSGSPIRTRAFAATSTSAVGPQRYVLGVDP